MSVTLKLYAKERKQELLGSIKKGMERATLIVENEAKRNVSQTGGRHPQVQTGELWSSISSRVASKGNDITGEVGTNVEYGKHLEFGTIRMPAYSWLFPAVESKKDEIKEALKGHRFIVG